MGVSWGSNRRRSNNCYQNPPPHHIAPSSSTSYYSSEPYPSLSVYPCHPGSPPPPPPPIHSSYFHSDGYSACNYANPMVGRANFGPFYPYQNRGWAGIRPPPLTAPPQPPLYFHYEQAKKIRNDVNVNKDALRLEVDEQNPDHHLVSFVFDASFDGSFTISYFAKEKPDCRFVPLSPEAYMSVKVPFQKGIGQKFHQPSGTGIDLGFFELDDLSKPSSEGDVFPLVVSAEACCPSVHIEEHLGEPRPSSSPNVQITLAVIQKNDEDAFHARVIRQIVWTGGVCYELHEIYGIGKSAAEGTTDDDLGKECVICMTEPKDMAVLPCRHMCMCVECAKALRFQSNKCPICRQPIDKLVQIKINGAD